MLELNRKKLLELFHELKDSKRSLGRMNALSFILITIIIMTIMNGAT